MKHVRSVRIVGGWGLNTPLNVFNPPPSCVCLFVLRVNVTPTDRTYRHWFFDININTKASFMCHKICRKYYFFSSTHGFLKLKMDQNPFSAGGASPRTSLGKLTSYNAPRRPSRPGRGTPPSHSSFPRRLGQMGVPISPPSAPRY